MGKLATLLTAFVALEHCAFAALEMIFWQEPIGLRTFGMSAEEAASSAVLAANQGLYNLFLVAGLVWSLVAKKRDVQIFFLLCVVVAGVFGGLTAKITILYTQALPALIALIAVLLAGRTQQSV